MAPWHAPSSHLAKSAVSGHAQYTFCNCLLSVSAWRNDFPIDTVSVELYNMPIGSQSDTIRPTIFTSSSRAIPADHGGLAVAALQLHFMGGDLEGVDAYLRFTAPLLHVLRLRFACLVVLTYLCFLSAIFPPAWAENYTGDFLTNGVGGRALGLGGAYTGVADDVTAAYWNPAGIATLDDNVQISLMRAARRSGLGSFNYIGAINRVNPWLTLGASWIHAGLDDIPIYPPFGPNIGPGERQNIAEYRPDFEPTGFLSDSENAYVITAAARIVISQEWWDNMGRDSQPPEFMFGVNVKRLSQSLTLNSADGIGFDAGILIRVLDTNAIFGAEGFGGFSVGLNVQDISETTLTWNTESQRKESIPTNVKFGLSYHNNAFSHRLVLAYEHETRYGGQNHFGLEYQLSKYLAVRAGLRDGDFTGGIGIHIDRFRLDYALLTGNLVSTHFFSLLTSF